MVNSFGPGCIAAALLLAHQGGWDEALLVIGPIVVITALLRLAKKRIDSRLGEQAGDQAGGDDGEVDLGVQTGEPGTRSIDAPTPAKRPTKSS